VGDQQKDHRMRIDDGPRDPAALPQGDLRLLETDQPGARMARIAVHPSWVGLLDFQTRVPAGFAQPA
jgi:hypothetical protein